ncbi:MAG TPA: hypothetical protein VNJ02_19605 [Vicinamibacterales bacterium]|nr:hypothetical protein [Vicinamibacterales bacterium]
MTDDVIGQPAREALGDTTRRCTATSKGTGTRCGSPPIPGGFVCRFHGGAVPAVRKSARERLLAMVDPALDALLRFLRTAPPCEHCGRSDADRDPVVLRAAQLVLDRTGFSPALAVTVTPAAPRADHLAWLPSEQLAQMTAWITEARAAMARGDTPPDMRRDTIDAVLVEDEMPDADSKVTAPVRPNLSARNP